VLRPNYEHFQTIARQNTTLLLEGVREWNRIGVEMLNFASRSVEEGARAIEAIPEAAAAAPSVDEAVGAQTEFAKRSYQDWLATLGKLGSTFVAISTDAYKPINAALINGFVPTIPSEEERTHH
jgi:hypothetical protein